MEAKHKIQLLFLSNLVIDKGLFDFLDSLKYLSDLKDLFYATIIGKPFDINEKQLSEYITSNKISEVVKYEGAKYAKEKYEYLKKESILIFPTYYKNEAFPLVILEAMQFRIPVISTFEGAIPDIIDDGVTGFLVPKNEPKIIAAKIRTLLNNPEQRVKMGQNAKNKFLEKYTLATFEKNMLSVFYEILSDN